MKAEVAIGPDAEFTFPFADRVATALALRRHDDLDKQIELIRDAAVAFVRLAWHIHLAYCMKRGIPFERIE